MLLFSNIFYHHGLETMHPDRPELRNEAQYSRSSIIYTN